MLDILSTVTDAELKGFVDFRGPMKVVEADEDEDSIPTLGDGTVGTSSDDENSDAKDDPEESTPSEEESSDVEDQTEDVEEQIEKKGAPDQAASQEQAAEEQIEKKVVPKQAGSQKKIPLHFVVSDSLSVSCCSEEQPVNEAVGVYSPPEQEEEYELIVFHIETDDEAIVDAKDSDFKDERGDFVGKLQNGGLLRFVYLLLFVAFLVATSTSRGLDARMLFQRPRARRLTPWSESQRTK